MLSQLTDADITNIGGSTWESDFTYKENGNMVSRTLDSTTNNFKYDWNDDQTDDCQIMTKIDSTALTTDKNGNLTAGASSDTYEWNWDGKLRSATKSSTTISLRYDPMGNRIFKQVGSTKRKYIVDIVGGLPVILMELDADDFSIEKTYIYANTQILAQHTGDTSASRYFYLHDRLGSVRQIISTNGTVQNRYTYNPFGQTFASELEETVSNPFRFTGQWYDSEIDQYYLRARMYSPHLSRFISRDPVFGKPDQPMTLHKYLYCFNSPINAVDLDGREVFWASRDTSKPVGNHHFILLVPDNPKDFEFIDSVYKSLTGTSLMVDIGGGKKGFTLGGFGEMDSENSLLFIPNYRDDIGSTVEYNNKNTRWYRSDWDFQSNKVAAPNGNDTDFIMTLLMQAFYYAYHEEDDHIGYNLKNMNCATWVNSMFNVSGVDERTRLSARDFSGFDWGEENLIDKKYSQSSHRFINSALQPDLL